jgi:hypothetical protein
VPGSGFDADDDNDGSRDGSRDNDDDDADDGLAGRARITFQEPQRTRPVVDMDSFDPSDVKLPITINIVAVRETLFADAPFISKNNKAFWRRMVDSKQFMQILSASYNFLSQCVSDSGAVLVDRLNNVQQSPLVGLIATSLTDIFYSFKRLDRDILLSRLPEVVHFMVLQALQTALPRHHRLYSSVRFREIMLDWCTELIWGMRTTNCRANREWLFHDAQVGTPRPVVNTVMSSLIPPFCNRPEGNPNLDAEQHRQQRQRQVQRHGGHRGQRHRHGHAQHCR